MQHALYPPYVPAYLRPAYPFVGSAEHPGTNIKGNQHAATQPGSPAVVSPLISRRHVLRPAVPMACPGLRSEAVQVKQGSCCSPALLHAVQSKVL
jgi:hypothetical protein